MKTKADRMLDDVWIDTYWYGKEVHERRIYEIVRKHSRWIDRINPKRMYMMASFVRDFVQIHTENASVKELFDLPGWKLFGKKKPPKKYDEIWECWEDVGN